jgi:hypothetical protein
MCQASKKIELSLPDTEQRFFPEFSVKKKWQLSDKKQATATTCRNLLPKTGASLREDILTE